MDEVEEIFDSFGKTQKEQDDYYGEDGLLYCGKCRTKRETKITYGGMVRTVPCICRCRSEKREKRKARDEYEEKMRMVERLRNNSLMESKYKAASFSSLIQTKENQKVCGIAKKYTEQFSTMFENNQGILFWGSVGTGKSYLAACIANTLLNNMVTVVMTSFVEILQKLQNPQFDESTYLENLNRVKLLIIDDLGTERNTDYALEKVYNVIDGRYRSGMPLILTTNMALDEMMKTTDIRYKRVYDRIFEMCYPVHVTGDSWRKTEAARRFDEMKSIMEG
ncbi:MAG: ATP-binding protein [Roseburia sp.]|nr:ATP-binding protein [Roseburia sp.]